MNYLLMKKTIILLSEECNVINITTNAVDSDYHRGKSYNKWGDYMENQKLIELDVREDLEQKIEPFDKIMGAVQQLKDGEALVLHTPFNPAPLHKVMERKGFDHIVEQIEEKHWKTTFSKKED